jgi:hypothetical protein
MKSVAVVSRRGFPGKKVVHDVNAVLAAGTKRSCTSMKSVAPSPRRKQKKKTASVEVVKEKTPDLDPPTTIPELSHKDYRKVHTLDVGDTVGTFLLYSCNPPPPPPVLNKQFNFEIPARFIPRKEPAFNDSPEKEVRRGSVAYLEFKLSRAQEHIKYLKATPMTPRELGAITASQDNTTRKKKVIETKHGSFNLLELMQKSKAAALLLDVEEKEKEAVANSKRALEAKKTADLLSYKLCQRKCACQEENCKWAYFTLCKEQGCGGLIEPLSSCVSSTCLKKRREAKKEEVKAKAAKQAADFKKYTNCQEQCTCPTAVCIWHKHRLCENPPCKVLLEEGANCRKRQCVKYRKDNGIAAQKPKPSSTPRKKKSRLLTAKKPTSAKKTDGVSSDSEDDNNSENAYNDSDSENQKSEPSEASASDYEIETIVSGPCRKRGPKYGKYEIKWLGYDTADNTWEPRVHIPDKTFAEYYAERQKMTGAKAVPSSM